VEILGLRVKKKEKRGKRKEEPSTMYQVPRDFNKRLST
jgi:hypothetical protein